MTQPALPDEIRKKIEDAANKRFGKGKRLAYSCFIIGAEFGYSLAHGGQGQAGGKEAPEQDGSPENIYRELIDEYSRLRGNVDYDKARLEGYHDAVWDLKMIIQDRLSIRL